jgi:hypothetical protein
VGVIAADRTDRRRWSPLAVVAAVIVVAWLAVQVAIPIKTFFIAGEQQFGWQMFSLQSHRPTYTVQFVDGSVKPVDWNKYVSRSRGDYHVDDAMPPFLCRRLPDAEIVFQHFRNKSTPKAYRCDR